MRFDIDHSTPYFMEIFQNVSDDDMTGGSEAIKVISEYHKKNHYLLNTGAVGYDPPSWSEEDNVFPSDAPVHPMTHIEWAAILKSMNLEGDVLEFGVAIDDFCFSIRGSALIETGTCGRSSSNIFLGMRDLSIEI